MLYAVLDDCLKTVSIDEKRKVMAMFEDMWCTSTVEDCMAKAKEIKCVLRDLKSEGKLTQLAYTTLYLMTEPVKA